MPRYYCDYCGTYLTHDSAPGRRQHNRGESHTPRGIAYNLLLLWLASLWSTPEPYCMVLFSLTAVVTYLYLAMRRVQLHMDTSKV